MAGWTGLKNLISDEIIERKDEGCNISGMRELLEAAGDDDKKLFEVYEKLRALTPEPDFPFTEPDDYEEIVKLSKGGVADAAFDLESAAAVDKFAGAWTGRCCGCALGKPFEIWPYVCGYEGRSGASYVKQWFEEADAWPIKGYAPAHSEAEKKVKNISVHCPKSHRENIKYMETDDDIRYLVLGLIITEEKGKNFTPWDVGRYWHSYLTYREVCTGETQAYFNFAQITSHTEGEAPSDPAEFAKKIRYTREHLNPYREWVGAQIRVDAYGYAAAGDPALAARMAYNDSSFSHVKNGIYGGMYTAAVIAAAFTEKSPMSCIEAGLAQIPATSRLYAEIKRTIELTGKASSQEDLLEKLWKEYSGYNWVHTINNASLCTAAFLWSEGDFERAITTAVCGGWDTDCNGATVGSMAGAMAGLSGIPEYWKAPLNNTLYSYIPDFHPISISECAERSRKAAINIKK